MQMFFVLITLVCEIFEVYKPLDVSDVVFAADFKNASGFAVSGLVFLQIHFFIQHSKSNNNVAY